MLVQTAVFLALVAAILLSLWFCAGRAAGVEGLSIPARISIFIFGNWMVDAVILIFLTAVNIWLVMGPLLRVEDPAHRTLQHLSLVFIQTVVLLVVSILAFTSMFLSLR
jgi:hypothetical protein